MVLIMMDERERGVMRDSLLKNFPQLDIQIRTLDVGDFILSPFVGIERKRGDDLIASIVDGRFFIQLSRLKEVFFHPILLLENPAKLFSHRYFKDSSIYGALVYVAYKMGITIITTINEGESAQVIQDLTNQIYTKKEIHPIEQKFQNLKDDDDISTLIDFHLTEKTMSREDQKYFISGLIDLGPKKADLLLDILQTPKFILHAIESSEIEFTKGGTPKNSTGILSNIAGIGPKFIHRNKKLLETFYSDAKKKKELTR